MKSQQLENKTGKTPFTNSRGRRPPAKFFFVTKLVCTGVNFFSSCVLTCLWYLVLGYVFP